MTMNLYTIKDLRLTQPKNSRPMDLSNSGDFIGNWFDDDLVGPLQPDGSHELKEVSFDWLRDHYLGEDTRGVGASIHGYPDGALEKPNFPEWPARPHLDSTPQEIFDWIVHRLFTQHRRATLEHSDRAAVVDHEDMNVRSVIGWLYPDEIALQFQNARNVDCDDPQWQEFFAKHETLIWELAIVHNCYDLRYWDLQFKIVADAHDLDHSSVDNYWSTEEGKATLLRVCPPLPRSGT